MTRTLTDSQWRHRSGFSPLSLFAQISNSMNADKKPMEAIALIKEQQSFLYQKHEGTEVGSRKDSSGFQRSAGEHRPVEPKIAPL